MTERPILSAYDGPPEPAREAAGYTDQDVQLVARTAYLSDWTNAAPDDFDRLPGEERLSYLNCARRQLAALAGTGRLLPEDTRTETQWAARYKPSGEVFDRDSEQDAREWIALDPALAHAWEVVRREHRVGPWVPAEEPQPFVCCGFNCPVDDNRACPDPRCPHHAPAAPEERPEDRDA